MKLLARIICLLVCLGLIGGTSVFAVNRHMISKVQPHILRDFSGFSGYDCILVLGAGVRENGSPSHMLSDRLEKSIEVFNAGVSGRLLMSGDHGRENYDEVNVMKAYAIDSGVPSEAVFMDHAGFSTYESLYRARDIFKAGKIVIITQEYHLYRALFIARSLGLEAVGIPAKDVTYYGQFYREVREILARTKDYIYTLTKPAPTYLGEAIPITGSGDLTNDK